MITIAFPACAAHLELRAREDELRRRAKEPRPFREAAEYGQAALQFQRLRFDHLENCLLCQRLEATRAA